MSGGLRDVLDDLQREVEKGEGAQPADLLSKAKRLVEKEGGDAIAVISLLLGENYNGRVKVRETLAKLPAEGSVVLSKDEAAKWETLKEYDPTALKTQLTERESLLSESAKTKREKELAAVAEHMKWKPSVLQELAKDLPITLQGDGDQRKATVTGADGKEQDLAAFAKDKWGDFLPSLATTPSGVRWPTQTPTSGGGAPPATPLDDRIKQAQQRAQAPNALRPAPVTTGTGGT